MRVHGGLRGGGPRPREQVRFFSRKNDFSMSVNSVAGRHNRVSLERHVRTADRRRSTLEKYERIPGVRGRKRERRRRRRQGRAPTPPRRGTVPPRSVSSS